MTLIPRLEVRLSLKVLVDSAHETEDDRLSASVKNDVSDKLTEMSKVAVQVTDSSERLWR